MSAFTGATLAGLLYALAVGEQHGSVTFDASPMWQPANPPLATVLAPKFWWMVGVAVGALAWIVLAERRLPDRPHLQGRHRAIPGAIAAVFTSLAVQAVLRMVPPSHASYTEDGFTRSVSPLWTVIAMTAVCCAGMAVYAVLRFIVGDPDEEPEPMSGPDPSWEARRRAAADAMRARTWEEPS